MLLKLSRLWVTLGIALALALGLTLVQGGSAQAAPLLDGESSTPTQGLPVPGAYLTADLGTWQPAEPEARTYQWLRDGAAIAGATNRDYLAQPADIGHLVAPQVTGTRKDYEPDTFIGTAVAVRKLTSSISLEVKRLHPPGKNRLAWTGEVSLNTERPWATDGGVVTLLRVDDGLNRVVGTGALVRGEAFVPLPWKRAPRGRTKVIACFAGTEAVAASCSDADVVRRPRQRR